MRLQNENEGAAKRSLAVLTELYRRHVWRDARTVNVIGECVEDGRLGCVWRGGARVQCPEYRGFMVFRLSCSYSCL